ncbi:hypothetical protein [Streptomyces sp. NPDC001665]
MSDLIRRSVAAVSAALLCIAGMTALATSASASGPATSSDTFPNGTISAAYSDTTLSAGDPFTVTVTFTNTSTTPQGVGYIFRDEGGSALFVYDSCDPPSSPAGSCGTAGTNVRATFAALPAGQSAVATIHAHVDPAVAAGTYDLFQSGTVGTSSRKDFDPGITFTVLPPATADLAVALTTTAGPLLSSQAHYTATVTNNGPGVVTASTTTVTLPTQTASITSLPWGCTYAPGTRTVTCDTGALANGATTSRAFTANFGLLSLGSLSATATRATSTPTDPNPANDTSTATCTVLTGLIITCP